MMSDYDFANDSMLELYLFETTTLLDQLDNILLQSEEDENLSLENVNEIFRIMHTIKGSSAMMEFDSLAHVAHRLEDLFYLVRDSGLDATYFQPLFDLVLRVSDFLKEEAQKIQRGERLFDEESPLIQEISALLDRMNETTLPEKEPPLADVQPKEAVIAAKENFLTSERAEKESTARDGQTHLAIDDAADSDLPLYHLHIWFASDCQMENIRAFMLVNKLDTFGQVVQTIPEELSSDAETSVSIAQNGFYCSLRTSLPPEKIEKAAKATLSVSRVEFIQSLPLSDQAFADEIISSANEHDYAGAADLPGLAEPLPADQAVDLEEVTLPADPEQLIPLFDPAEAEAAATQNGSPLSRGGPTSSTDDTMQLKSTKQNLISVDLNKLDTLMDLVGEIVITESMVSGNTDLAGLALENFNKAARQLRKLTDELQDIVMSIRMVPISATFQKMRRVVRDMGRKLDKDVDLIIIGETTEVDKTIIDGIGDPLMHLVRNAMDHAIETREERVAAKKPPTGQIVLSAQNMGGDILISVSDDGRGLNAEMLLAKAKEKNILTKPENEYTEKEIFNLLTAPGFSTKEAVTEFSGRGVGMDVVKKNIEKIGGSITIESVFGSGTNVFFKIPLTLAIISSMEIRVSDNIYAIPISNIRESFKASDHHLIKDPDGNEMVMIRGVCYPIIRLHRIFHHDDSFKPIEEGILLLVDSGDRLACLFADELLGKHQVVVKPLPLYLSRYAGSNKGVAGCTILGDGSISLILDIASILDRH